MLDVGWSELLVVGAVALVAIGPKDLPKVMHTLGGWMGKARRMMLAVQHDIERMGYEAEQEERRKKGEAAHDD
ncbi:MAG: Sec-independent protein translocase protein TatB [Alphaproteobacteria bacterium]|nr:Sec-independent protein translocase protein TatB [Alphaproteobacteria bacterium]